MQRLIARMNRARCWRSTWRVYGFQFFAPTLDRALYLAFHKFGISGADERVLLERLIRPGDHVLDIGANIGLYTAVIARAAGLKGRVLAFEPMPDMAEALRKAVEWNQLDSVTVHPVALGDRNGTLRMARQSFNSGDNRVTSEGSIEVPVLCGDALVDFPALDVIKIDVQGYELPALRGLSSALARSPQLRILFEFWPKGLALAGTDPADFVRFLQDAGFALYQILPHATLAPIPWERIADHLISRPWGPCANFVASRGPL